MNINLDIDVRQVEEALCEFMSHDELHNHIIMLDEQAADYDFTLKLIRALVASLRKCDDPNDPLKPGDLF